MNLQTEFDRITEAQELLYDIQLIQGQLKCVTDSLKLNLNYPFMKKSIEKQRTKLRRLAAIEVRLIEIYLDLINIESKRNN